MTHLAQDRFILLNQVPLGICILRGDYVVLFWNQCLEEWTHISRDRIIGRAIYEFFPHFQNARYTSRLSSIFEGGPPTVFSSQLHPHLIPAPLPTGGKRTQQTTVTAIPASEEDGFYAMLSIQDVTDLTFRVQEYRKMRDRAIAEAEDRKRAQELAEAANRVKDEFLAIVSHEIRTPLNPILGWSRLLRDGKLSEAVSQKAIETIARNAALQTQLIDDLLDVSRILRGKLQLHWGTVDLVYAIHSALDTVKMAADAKLLTLRFPVPDAPYVTQGDATRLQQIVWNLVSNAIKFTPAGGQIDITLSATTSPEQRIITLSVQDSGQGISPDFLPYVFDSFRQADGSTTRTIGGLGLGLSITRHLVELHGGYITAESEGTGKGAKFVVVLPAPLLEAAPSLSDPAPSLVVPDLAQLQGLKILVVDDERDTLDFLVFLLQEYGATTLPALSVKEAIAQMEQTIPSLIISDLGMPDADGYELIRYVRSQPRLCHIPAIALTAYVAEATQHQVITAGFQYHLSKPTATDKLIDAIEHLVRFQPVLMSKQWKLRSQP